MRISEAKAEYRASRAGQGIKVSTLDNNGWDLDWLLKVAGDINIKSLQPRHIDNVFAEAGKTRGPGSLGNLHASLTAFFRWCQMRSIMPLTQNPMGGRRAPKPKSRPRMVVRVSRFQALLEAAGAISPRDRAVVALGLYLMLRQSEIATLRVRDLNLDTGIISVLIHKTDDHDEMPICAELDVELRSWLSHYTQENGVPASSWHLVPGRKVLPSGKQQLMPEKPITNMHRIAQGALTAIGEVIVDENGKTTNEGMHTLRRSGARALFDEMSRQNYDGALRRVQSILHHKHSTMTEHYLGITIDRELRNKDLVGKVMFRSISDPDAAITDLIAYRTASGEEEG